ncbi:MAG: hybrid sensor histidine kinase/response regulator, partial [Bradyrhizobium sp.]|nr:hybrid sensor histidine kinase/response regulator [Bradyrhizobium sp.]
MSTLIPHGVCLQWSTDLIWLNAVSDALVGTAFFSMAYVLGYYVWKRRREVMFRSVFWSLAIFAAACGLTRVEAIFTLWVPAYGIEA